MILCKYMNESKLFEEDNRPDYIKKNEVGIGKINYNNKEYTYTIVKKELELKLPGFLGFPEGKHLFISEEVPFKFRNPQLIHEILEFTKLKSIKGRCLESLKNEFLFIPEEIKEEYIEYRRNFFDRLIQYSKDFTDEDFKSEIKASYEYLCTL